MIFTYLWRYLYRWRIYIRAGSWGRATHCQLTPVDLPTRDMYVATYLRESGVESSHAFFSSRFPAGMLLYVYTTHPSCYIVVRKRLLLLLLLVVFKSRGFVVFHLATERRTPSEVLNYWQFSHLCKWSFTDKVTQEASWDVLRPETFRIAREFQTREQGSSFN